MSTKLIHLSDLQRGREPGDGTWYSRWGSIPEIASRMTDNVSSEESVLLLGGDLINMGERTEEMKDIIRRVRERTEGNTVLACPGNSDWKEFDLLAGEFRLPRNGPAGYENRFYSWEKGPCHIIVLDSNLMGNGSIGWIGKLQDWIRKDLEATSYPAIVVMMHHPMWLPGYGEDDQARAALMQREYLPLFKEYGVDLILCGHQHLYARRDPKDEKEPVQIMGVAGTKYFPAREPESFDVIVENRSTATIIDIDDDRMEIRTVDADEKEVDHMCMPLLSRNKTSQRIDPDGPEMEGGDHAEDPTGESLLIRIHGEEVCRMTDDDIRALPKHRVAYSVFRRGGLKREEKEGVLLEDVLTKAGWKMSDMKPEDCLCFTSAEGLTRTVIMSDLFEGRSYIDDEEVPAMLSFERDDRAICGMRLITGQTGPEEHNGCRWIRNVGALDIISIPDLAEYKL